jgi:magnesium chelatase family protein
MSMVSKYQKRISGPILDRIDIHLDVPRVPVQKLSSLSGGEPSYSIRQRVEAARSIQHARFAQVNKPNVLVNGDMGPAEVQKFCQLDKEGSQMIRMAVERMGLSARSYHRLLKLSRTIADLAECEQILVPHLAEALQYRRQTMFA